MPHSDEHGASVRCSRALDAHRRDEATAAKPGGILVFTNIPAPYRIPTFNALAKMAGADFRVIFAAPGEARRTWKLDSGGMSFAWELLSTRIAKRSPAEALACAVALWSILQRRRPDAVICGGYSSLAAWAAFWWCKAHRRRFVLWLESNGRGVASRPLRRATTWIKRLMISRADAVAAAGRASSEYVRSLGARDERIFIAPFGGDYAAFAHEADKIDAAREKKARGFPPRLALYAGRLVREKGVFVLLEAFRKVATEIPDAGLLVTGHGPAEYEMREMCTRKNIKRVFFEGAQEYAGMPYYYALADILVLPTFREAWGFVVNEAFACAVPAIISRIAGACDDLIVEGETGFGIGCGDVAGLAEAISKVLRDGALRARMSANCRQKIRSYPAEACAAGLMRAASGAGRDAPAAFQPALVSEP